MQDALAPVPRMKPQWSPIVKENTMTPSKQNTNPFSGALIDLINIHELCQDIAHLKISTETALTLASTFLHPSGPSRSQCWGTYNLVSQDSTH